MAKTDWDRCADLLNRIDECETGGDRVSTIVHFLQDVREECGVHRRGEAATPQPPPVGNGVGVDGFVIQDILERSEMGKAKYGTTLRTFNGRDALVDLYQELLDAVKYCKQAILERSKKDLASPDEKA
jgi:hypothetical protein